jgi:aryl-alcohol dehydrogenase-like predicted oxidoreductase
MARLVPIGHSSVTTAKLGLGTNKVGGHNLFPDLKDADGTAVIKTALDHGLTTLDTAYMYGLGRSEELIGDVIQHYDREKLVIATKAAHRPDDPKKIDNSPAFLKAAVEAALKRLKTDYIDIFYIHFPDQTTDKAEAVAALDQMRQQGKLKAIGVSNFSLAEIKAANQADLVDVVEDHYSLVHRDAETTLFPYLRPHQISFVPYFPLESGLLTGKYGPADGQRFKQFSSARYAAILQAIEQARRIAQDHQATVAQVVLAWYMMNPDLALIIPGARQADQVLQNIKAFDVDLTLDEYHEIDQAFQFHD